MIFISLFKVRVVEGGDAGMGCLDWDLGGQSSISLSTTNSLGHSGAITTPHPPLPHTQHTHWSVSSSVKKEWLHKFLPVFIFCHQSWVTPVTQAGGLRTRAKPPQFQALTSTFVFLSAWPVGQGSTAAC